MGGISERRTAPVNLISALTRHSSRTAKVFATCLEGFPLAPAKFALLLVCALAIGGMPPAFAEDTTAPAATAPVPAASGPSLAAQSAAANGPSPITLRLQYTGEIGDNVTGGLHDGATYMNNILAQFHVDTGKAFGWTGGFLAVEAFYENADSLGAHYVGAVQDPSVIDTGGVAMFRLYQAYYRQQIGQTNILVGIYDPETEFGATRPMDVFFNGAYAWNTALDHSGINGPSTYPFTSLGLRVRQTLPDHWSVQFAALDGVPDSPKYPAINAVNINNMNGALLLGEVDYTPTALNKAMAGFWHYTGQFPSLGQINADGTPRLIYGSTGAYIGGSMRVYSQTARRGLDVFTNLGAATGNTQQVDGSLNFGVRYVGPFDARPSDQLGAAVGIARASQAYQQAQVAAGVGVKAYETNFELTYRAHVTDWLTIQPDIQYWINPNMDPTLKNDLLFLLHFEISHVFDL
jgi:porin